MDMYRQEILEHFKHPHNFGTIDHALCSAALANTSCGDRIQMDVNIKKVGDKEIVEAIKFSGIGCAISIASASLLTDAVRGKDRSWIESLKPEFVYDLLGTPLTPSRIKCALLPLEVLQKSISGK